MKIAYRRMSGGIGVSLKERGTRGLWWEKRRALLSTLVDRGHEVDFVGRMTKESAHLPVEKLSSKHELLFVEFGSANKSFYGDDLDETIKMVEQHMGQIVFLNDDPDLPYLWDTLKSSKNWSCWYNAYHGKPFGKQPADIKIFDMPFSSLQKENYPSKAYQADAMVYIGRPNGRAAIVKKLIASQTKWRVFGKQKEWDDYGLIAHTPPDQPNRQEFYSKQIGCLVLADKKHKEMGWRTGRAYHAFAAGCPAIVEEDHKFLKPFPKWGSPWDIDRHFHRWRDPDLRERDWCKIREIILWDRMIAEETFKAHGL